MEEDSYTEYLGDSVYIETNGYHIVLYTDNGEGKKNQVYLEPEYIELILDYKKRIIDDPDYPQSEF